MEDLELLRLFKLEEDRQNGGIELIASENYPSKQVRAASSSIFMAKYAEGYPGRRYYGGCVNVDSGENLAIERAKKLFNCKYANVQPHSGSQANFAAYHALLSPGDKILSLTLNDGGHLTHGSPVSFSSHTYAFSFYPLGDDGRLDYEIIAKRLEEENPNLFLAGYSAYPYDIDFKRMRELIDEHNAHSPVHCYFMVDMAHIAGIVAAKLCQNPCDYADIVTSTTHKTLRGPRGGLILSNDEALGKKINSSIFPYTQGGPLEHVIASKAVNFLEDLQPSFVTYMKGVLENTSACAEELKKRGCVVFGSENHLFLLDVLSSFSINGKQAQERLESIGITANKNMIHGDTLTPNLASGLRVGFAAATSRGCSKEEAIKIAGIIYEALKDLNAPVEPLKAAVGEIVSGWKNVMELEYLGQ
ncbi:MAG: serine hydroxymethyltransferase [Bacillota bacterium]|nr:serine hydroxymethyltransferase [Bacillota bacterium]